MSDVLQGFKTWLPTNSMPWGNGATFDISILENAYRMINVNPRWRFYNVRDCRTIKAIAPPSFVMPELKGTAHNALDDAKHQAKWVSDIIMQLRRNNG